MKESRLFKIVYYILEKGRMTAPELAEKFEVSVRTIYRDIDVISSAGIPIYVTTGRNGGIQILDNYVLEKCLFSDKEKQDILADLQSVAVIDNIYQKEMLTKLSALFNIRSNNWFEVDFARWGKKTYDNSKFELLKRAVINDKAVTIVYMNSYGIQSKRKIHPLRLLYKSKEWYVKAYCTDKQDFRIFKFNRIAELEVSDETFIPVEFPNSQESPSITINIITLKFSKEMAYRIYDEFEPAEVVKQKDGSFIVSAELPEDAWLTGYLLSFGAQVEVIEPVYLRQVLLNEAKKIYETYKP